MKIAATAGTGPIGLAGGQDPDRGRRGGGAALAGHRPEPGQRESLSEAGADAVVNLTNSPTFDDASPVFFRTTMRPARCCAPVTALIVEGLAAAGAWRRAGKMRG